MVYAQCVKSVTITNSKFDGNEVYRGAIHLGDSTEYATVATITGNTISDTARGVQIGNRVADTIVTYSDNTVDVAATMGEAGSAALYIHEVADPDAVKIIMNGNEVCYSLAVLSENASGAITDFVTAFSRNTKDSEPIELNDSCEDTAYVPVARIGDKYFTDFKTAVDTAKSGETVVLLCDISVENVSGNGVSSINVPAGVTIDGDDGNGGQYTITFDAIYHGSVNAAFHSSTGSYTVKNVKVDLTTDNSNGFAFDMAKGGTLENVTIDHISAGGVYAGSGTTIRKCVFNTATSGAYFGVSNEGAPGNIVIEDCVFNGNRAAVLYGTNITFTDNTVYSDKGLSIAAASGIVTGNNFLGECAVSIYSTGTTIHCNRIREDGFVEFFVEVDLSRNYWGGGEPTASQLVGEGDVEATVDSYYTIVKADGRLDGLVRTGTFTVSFNADGGECGAISLTTVEGGKLSELPAATRIGYTFNGWYNGTEKVNADTVYSQDITLTAKWTANSYRVTLVANGGTIHSGNVTEYIYGIGATLPTNVAKNGYFFGGWYDNEACTGAPVTEIAASDIGDKVFYAKWDFDITPFLPLLIKHDIDIADGMSGGSITTDKSSASVNDRISITVVPLEGYEIDTVIVADTSGNTIEVTANGEGKYSFKMPMKDVTVYAEFTKTAVPAAPAACPKDHTCPIYPFSDAQTTAWYHDGVHFCIEHGLMVGCDGGTFRPNTAATRAMIVTVLWRMEGSPVVDYAMTFEDVDADAWYAEAVRWAQSAGIAEGCSDTVFGPDDSITREQMATILWRYCKGKGVDVSVGETTNILSYGDALSVSEWAIPAMQWACGSGMIQGIADGSTVNLEPTGSATRAQVAAILYRFCGWILNK